MNFTQKQRDVFENICDFSQINMISFQNYDISHETLFGCKKLQNSEKNSGNMHKTAQYHGIDVL